MCPEHKGESTKQQELKIVVNVVNDLQINEFRRSHWSGFPRDAATVRLGRVCSPVND